jgi:hypothetical protein
MTRRPKKILAWFPVAACVPTFPPTAMAEFGDTNTTLALVGDPVISVSGVRMGSLFLDDETIELQSFLPSLL